MERDKIDVHHYIRNIFSDNEFVVMLCITERLLNSSVKKPLGASPNALLFGNVTTQEPGMMAEMDQMPSDTVKTSVRDYIDKFMAKQGKLVNAARRSQEATNDDNLRKYANYQRHPELRARAVRQGVSEGHEHPKDDPSAVAHIVARTHQEARTPRSPAQIWIRDPRNLDTYIKLVYTVDSISETRYRTSSRQRNTSRI